MEFLKSIFGDKALTFSDLEAALKDNKEIKLANLASGQYVDKDKFDKAETKANDLQAQLTQRDKDIEELKKVDAKGLQDKLTELQGKYDTDTKNLNDKLTKQALNSKIDFTLVSEKAKSIKAVKALLDVEKIKLDGENVLGLTDQLEAIKKENPFLFGEDKNPSPPVGGKPANDQNDDMAKWAAEANVALPKTN